MRFESWESYINAMLSQVKFRFDHKDIRAEYEEHMEDKLEFLMDCGMDEERAAREVLTEMGEPKSLGKALNEIHNPLLGWIWWVSRILAILVAAAVIFSAGKNLFSHVKVLVADYPQIDENGRQLVYQLDINEKVRIDDEIIIIDSFRRYDDNLCVVNYTTQKRLISRSGQYTTNFGILAEFKDDKGTVYRGEFDYTSGFKAEKCITYFAISPETDYLLFDVTHADRSLHISIPVRELPGNPEAEVSVR